MTPEIVSARFLKNQVTKSSVIDIGLPHMDEYELARKLREIPETRDSRLIAVTGYGTKADTHNAWDSVAYHVFINKPDPNTERR